MTSGGTRQPGVLEGELLREDLPCKQCGYNLRGLRTTDRCPECGTAVGGGRTKRVRRDSLTDAPIEYLKMLRLGCFMLAAGAVGSAAAMVIAKYSGDVWLAGVAAFMSVVWWGGVWIVTTPEQRTLRETGLAAKGVAGLRWFERVTQGVWLLAAVLLMINLGQAVVGGAANLGRASGVLHALAVTLGLFLLAPVAIHMGRLAAWGEDEDLQERLKLVALGLGIAGPAAFVLPRLAPMVGGGLAVVMTFMWVMMMLAFAVSMFAFLWSVVSVANMAAWAVNNAKTHAESEARIRAKLAERYASMGAGSADERGSYTGGTPRVKKPGATSPGTAPKAGPPAVGDGPGADAPIPLADPGPNPRTIRPG